MKYAILLLLSIMLPQTLMGLNTPAYNNDKYTNNNVTSQKILVQGNDISVNRENWLLDVTWPVIDYEKTTSGFGYRSITACSSCSTYHQGLDFVPGEGEYVYNIMNGEVVDIGWDGSFGYRAVIRHIIHPNELEYTTIYAHMEPTKISKNLQEGDTVKKGDTLGIVGNTGVSTGPHLHFEIHRNNKVLDPLKFFKKHLVD